MPERTGPPTEPCRLCGATSVLQLSHIVPRWIYRRLTRGSDSLASSGTVHVDQETALLSSAQSKEYLLCRQCEGLLSGAEEYVSTIADQEDHRFPALDKITVIATSPQHKWDLARAGSLDVDAVARFAVSIFWRASVSGLPDYATVSLGERHEQTFARFLLGSVTFPDGAHLIVELFRSPTPALTNRVVFLPFHRRSGASHVHRFTALGMAFHLHVGSLVPAPVVRSCFVKNGLVLVSDGRTVIETAVEFARSAKPKGKLASR